MEPGRALLFRRSDSQTTLGSLEVLLSPKKRAYLETKHGSVESCWIRGAFRRKALPVLLRNESVFAPLFCADNGRPNDSRRTAHVDPAACAAYPLMQVCPTRFNGRAETMTFYWSPAEGATAARRRAEQTPAFKTRYRMRSGIEATNSE